MAQLEEEKESFLNLTYLSAIFYNYAVNSRDNFTKVNMPENEDKFDILFEEMNYDNYSTYLEYMSLLNDYKESAKQIKIKKIKSIFNLFK